MIGGYDVAFHGHSRVTDDIDVLIAPDEENVQRVERMDQGDLVAPEPTQRSTRRR